MSKQLFEFSQKEINGTYSAEIRTTKVFVDKYGRDIASKVTLELTGEYISEQTLKDSDYPEKMKRMGLNDLINDFLSRIIKEVENAPHTTI